MRKAIIGLTAALAVVLGLAAPASADGVGIQAVVGTAWESTTGTGKTESLLSDPVCAQFVVPDALNGLATVGAQSATVNFPAGVGVRFFTDTLCQSTTTKLVLNNNTLTALGLTAHSYQWVVV